MECHLQCEPLRCQIHTPELHNADAHLTVVRYMCCIPPLQALASASATGNGANAVAQVIAEAFSSGGNAAAVAEAVAGAYGKNKGGTTTALASALAQANSDGGKTGAAAQAVAEVRLALECGLVHCRLLLSAHYSGRCRRTVCCHGVS